MHRVIFFFFIFISMHCFSMDEMDCTSFSEKHFLVKLPAHVITPSFYVRGKNHIIFFKEENIRKYFARTSNDVLSERFKKKLLAHFPLKQNLDLYIDLLTDNTLVRNYDFLIADLLEAGEAEVLHINEIWPGEENSTTEIKLYKPKGSISGFRYFCDPQNREVFHIMDYIS